MDTPSPGDSLEFDLSRFDSGNIRRNLAGFKGGLIGAVVVWLAAFGIWAAFGFDTSDSPIFEFVLPVTTAVVLVVLAIPAFLMRARTLRVDSEGLEAVGVQGGLRRVRWDDPQLLVRLNDRSMSSRGDLIKRPPFRVFCWKIRTESEVQSEAFRAILATARSKGLRVSELGRSDMGAGNYLIEAPASIPA